MRTFKPHSIHPHVREIGGRRSFQVLHELRGKGVGAAVREIDHDAFCFPIVVGRLNTRGARSSISRPV